MSTMAAERNGSSFSEMHMTNFLDGSEAATELRRGIMDELDGLARHESSGTPIELGDGTLLDPSGIMPNEDHTLAESRLQTMKMLRFQFDRLLNDDESTAAKRRFRMQLMSLFDPAWFTRNGVHFGLWVGAVRGQGSAAQASQLLSNSYPHLLVTRGLLF